MADALARAFELHQNGNLADAERGYRALLAAEPAHFDAAHLLGVVLLQREQFDEAERQFAAAIRINQNIAPAYNNRGNALRKLKRFDEALASYDRAIALKPSYAEAYNNRGNVLRNLKRYPEAVESYEKAIALKPDYAVAQSNRKVALRDAGRPEDAAFTIDPAAFSAGVIDAHPNVKRHHPIDREYGIDTSGHISKDNLGAVGVATEKISNYVAVQPSIVRRTLRVLADLSEYSFYDLGCGKGRALAVATEFPFRKIVGIEISSMLADVARTNAASVAEKFPRRTKIEIVEGNAVDISMAAGKVVFFLYNPFDPDLMAQLMKNIERGLENSIQHAFVIYHNPIAESVFETSPGLMRWFGANFRCDESEQDFAYPFEGSTIIWQSRRNALVPPQRLPGRD